MRKSKKRSTPSPLPVSAESVELRLCHFCFHLNESSAPIVQCEKCAHYLTADAELIGLDPGSDSDFDEQEVVEYQEDESEEALASGRRRYSRITGLSVFW